MKVELVYSPAPAEVHRLALTLDAGASVQTAVDASGWLSRWPELATLDCGIWGRRVSRDTLLQDEDRVEIYRPLRIDPKEARRQRAQRKAYSRGP